MILNLLLIKYFAVSNFTNVRTLVDSDQCTNLELREFWTFKTLLY